VVGIDGTVAGSSRADPEVVMTTSIALLRGVNVGGRKLAMAGVREAFVDAGHGDVRTYIQSGNVVFTHTRRAEAALAEDLTRRVSELAGYDVPVILRTAKQWAAMMAANPYRGERQAFVHVAFLASPPPPGERDAVDASAFAPEEYVVVGRDAYLYLPNGIGRAKLPVALGRKGPTGVATVRNWRTVEKLADLAGV
jgi:uncharacterized protein (DUF1697 family)